MSDEIASLQPDYAGCEEGSSNAVRQSVQELLCSVGLPLEKTL